MASYPLGKQTDEHEEEASLDGGTFHQPNIQSTAAVYPPVVPGCSRSSATSRSRDIARGIPKEPTTHTSDTYAPYVETALGQAKTEPSVGQVVGPQLTAEADFFDLKRPYKTPIPGVKNAYTSNYLPTPALGVYKQNPPPIKSIGKFIHHPKYKTGNERYLGFLKNNWPLESPSAYDLATAGMVYIGESIKEFFIFT